jgi:hypothetical protein
MKGGLVFIGEVVDAVVSAVDVLGGTVEGLGLWVFHRNVYNVYDW